MKNTCENALFFSVSPESENHDAALIAHWRMHRSGRGITLSALFAQISEAHLIFHTSWQTNPWADFNDKGIVEKGIELSSF